MISNQILQSTLNGIKDISKVDLCVTDTDGKVLASTVSDSDKYSSQALNFIESQADSQIVSGWEFFKVFDENQLEYILMIKGSTADLNVLGRMVVFQLQNMIVAYKERFDKDNFVKNLLLDNLLLVDIYNRAKKLHIEAENPRVVFIVETNREKEGGELDVIRSLFVTRRDDYVTAVDENNIIVVRELSEGEDIKTLFKVAESMLGVLKTEGNRDVHVAFGNVVTDIKDVSASYKEAKMALDVGKIFFEEKDIVAYAQLGIGRLIYQLPLPLCKIFIKEIFGQKSPDEFDDETLVTINKFFENSLNVSETSRQLYIHRNTLVYRLDKLEKSTGLDLRVFEDAITFKIALMVVKYMKYLEEMEF